MNPHKNTFGSETVKIMLKNLTILNGNNFWQKRSSKRLKKGQEILGPQLTLGLTKEKQILWWTTGPA